MSKRAWIIPLVIVAVNALAILIRWSSLPETLLAHFDLQGHAGGSMPVFMLAEPVILVAAIVVFVICLVKGRK